MTLNLFSDYTSKVKKVYNIVSMIYLSAGELKITIRKDNGELIDQVISTNEYLFFSIYSEV